MKLNSLIIDALKTRYEEILSTLFVYKNGELTLNDDFYTLYNDKDSLRISFKINEEFDILQLNILAYIHYMKGHPNSSKEEFDILFNNYNAIKKFNL